MRKLRLSESKTSLLGFAEREQLHEDEVRINEK